MNRTTGRPHALPSLSFFAAALIASAIVAFAGVSTARAATASLPANATVTGIGSIVNIDLTLSSAAGTEAADIDVRYNASVVRIGGDAVVGQLGANANCQVTTNAANLGVVRFGVACVNQTASAGVLLVIPFQAFAPGVADLSVSRCSLNELGIDCVGGTGKITVSVATPTGAQTITGTPTATPLPPTATRTRTSTATVPPPTPSLTRTRTATVTAAPPTATRTRTSTATITRTSPPVPTATRTNTRTATAVVVPTPSMSALAILASCPTTMTAGRQNVVTVTMRNNGNTTWTAAQGYRLGAINPYDNFNWGMNRVLLGASDSIAPGQDKVFSWAVTAPATAGTYNFQWRMVREGVAWFGDLSSNLSVVVNGQVPTATRTSIPPPSTPTPVATATRTATRTNTPVVIDGVFVSQTVPTTMTAGQPVSVSVTMRNNGNTTWTAAQGYRLGAINPYDNFNWGMNRVLLGASDSIAPGQDKVFTWTVTAPAAPGTYNFQWRMVREGVAWFGDLSSNLSVVVNGQVPTATRTSIPPSSTPTPVATATRTATRTNTPVVIDGVFVSQTVPTTMTAGQPVSVSVTMRNTGTTTWSTGNLYRLGAINPYDNFTWGMNRVLFPANEFIGPGQEKTFTWNVTAPPAGTYNFQWRMVQEGVLWFGATTPNVVVTVNEAPPAPSDAAFVAQMFPTTVPLGQSFTASVTMRNTGGTTWTAAQQFRLGSIHPQDTLAWGANRVNLGPSESIAPGQEKTFTWTATVPPATGFYNFQWRMVQDGVAFFGQSTTNLVITVPLQ